MVASSFFAGVEAPSLNRFGPAMGRVTLLSSLFGGAIAASMAVPIAQASAAVEAAGPELTRLLRGMALVKAGLVATLLAGIVWRLAAPISALGLVGYSSAAAAMGAGIVLTWSLVALGWGALLLHIGLIGGVILLARDKAVGQRLARLLLRR